MIKLCITLMFLFLAETSFGANFDPSFDFKTHETEHFSIHYHQGLEPLARKTATIAEEAHRSLAPLLAWLPGEKTNIILVDNDDFANGMATVLPWNAIFLQTVPPSIMSTIGEYDDWLRLIIIHEYTHILTSDPVRGYSRITRQVFGKTFPLGDPVNLILFLLTGPPNVMMPGWWHEGMATWAETELTSSGRGRSSFYEMIYRTAVAEKNLPTIDIINGDIPYWPGGNSPYIFGSRLMQYIASTYGKDKLGKISIQQSGRFPYFINGTPEEQLKDKDYPALYNEMLSALTKEQEERIAVLARHPFTRLRKIGLPGAWESAPRFSPDGRLLAFNRDDRHNHARIVITDTNGNMQASFERLPGDGALSWDADSRSIYFSQAEVISNVNIYQDIYRYDLDRKTIERITDGMRAAEPDISPDGKRLAVVLTSRGSQNLALLELGNGSKNTAKQLTSYHGFRVASPRWSPDGTQLVFTMTDNNGTTSLLLMDGATGQSKSLASGRSSIATPTWSRDGQKILYTSDANGVFNIFSISLIDNSVTQLTHLPSGGFSPDMAADSTLALALYTSKGFTIATIDNESLLQNMSSIPSIKGERYPVTFKATTAEPQDNPAEPASVPYSPWKTLAPRFWLPTLIPDGPEGIAPGLMTAGQDILGYHTVVANAWYGTEFNRNYFDLYYKYGRFTPSLTLQGYALPSTYSDLLGRGDYTEIERGLIAGITLPLQKLESGLDITAGYHLRDQKALSELSGNRFNGLPVFQGRRDSFFAGFSYGNSRKYPWSVSHEEGRNLTGRVDYYSSNSGSEIESREYTITWQEFLRLNGHHTLMLRLAGGMAEGERTPQQAFQLGGLTSQFNPFGVRGYEQGSAAGDYVATGTAEYRFPAWYFLRGFRTKPVFFDRLHGALFVDAGEVWSKERSFRGNKLRIGAGTEIRMDFTIGYWLKVTPAVGYAHGFDHGGIDQIYFNIYTNM